MLPMTPMYMLYFIPLLVSVSFVYAGTRHENPKEIIKQAWHTAYWIVAFMGIIFVILWIVGWFL